MVSNTQQNPGGLEVAGSTKAEQILDTEQCWGHTGVQA